MSLIKCATVALLLFGLACAEVAKFVPCTKVNQDACTISEVRVSPCKDKRFCRLTKGSPASIEFDFTPNFTADTLKTGLFWAHGNDDVPFPDLEDADGCALTTCPTASGTEQRLTYRLNLSKLLPSGTYDFKWKLWNEANKDQVCCFITQIKLVKGKTK